MTVVWRGPEFVASVLVPAVNDGLTQAAALVARDMQRNIGSEGGGPYVRVKGSGQARLVGPGAPPGSFPGFRTGRLARSMTFTRGNRLVARAGTNVRYGLFLERGTSRMQPRPWAARTLRSSRRDAQRVFTRATARSIARRAVGVSGGGAA